VLQEIANVMQERQVAMDHQFKGPRRSQRKLTTNRRLGGYAW